MGSERSEALRVCLVGLAAGRGSGVSRYAATLGRALDRVSEEFPALTLALVTTRAGAEAVAAERIQVRDFGLRSRLADAGPLRVPLEQLVVATQQADLLHFFDLTGPLLVRRRPFVTTIHDAGVVHGFRRIRHAYKRRLQPWALRHAAAVVAVSQFTKDEAIWHFDVQADKVRVIHSGPGLGMTSSSSPPTATAGTDPYLLYVGDLTTKKNVSFLIRAFARAEVPGRLVLAGRPGGGYGRVTDEIARSPKRDRIQLVDGPSDHQLDELYRSATALLLPSRYEGFGFTPLEAMSRGCPVLATDLPAVREVSGQGAQLLPVDDEPAWADAMTRIAADEHLRTDLRARGAKTVAGYSWEKTARDLCGLFLSLRPQAR